MKIIQLEAENIKRLRAVTIEPKENVVEISGKNESGKSSTLDSIMYALGGKDSIADEPLRQGEKKGKVVLNLGKYKVTRTFTAAGGGTLKVESADGSEYKSPQTLLDGFLNDLTFDPLRFVKASPGAQKDMLLEISQIPVNLADLSKLLPASVPLSGKMYSTNPSLACLEIIADIIKAITDQRVLVGRDRDRAKGAWESIILPDDTPAEPIDLADLIKKRQDANEVVMRKQQLIDEKERRITELSYVREKLAGMEQQIEDLRVRFAKEREAENALTFNIKECEGAILNMPPAPDNSALDEQFRSAQFLNKAYERAQEKKGLQETWMGFESTYNNLTNSIIAARKEREDLLVKTKFPIDNLSINDDGRITLAGVPIDQRGTSKQILLGLTICAALNPLLRVILLRDGNDIDGDNMKLISQWATENNMQVWIERVADSPKGHLFYIEDGGIFQERADEPADKG